MQTRPTRALERFPLETLRQGRHPSRTKGKDAREVLQNWAAAQIREHWHRCVGVAETHGRTRSHAWPGLCPLPLRDVLIAEARNVRYQLRPHLQTWVPESHLLAFVCEDMCSRSIEMGPASGGAISALSGETSHSPQKPEDTTKTSQRRFQIMTEKLGAKPKGAVRSPTANAAPMAGAWTLARLR